ncbi:MAG: hypothetical protein PUG67_02085 [Peptoniphilaceae bacterium]|nr:hypothetical protein [Peptoniphilaceae bacterium]MDY6018874.1 hypothetical protein [Anaerococcus sp.]
MISLQLDLKLANDNKKPEIEKKLAYYEQMDGLYPSLKSILEKSITSKDPLALENKKYIESLNKLETILIDAYKDKVIDEQMFYIYGKTYNETRINSEFTKDAIEKGKNVIINNYNKSPLRRVNLFLSDLYIGILFFIYSLFFIDNFYSGIREGYYQLLYFGKNKRKEILAKEICFKYLMVMVILIINISAIFIINYRKGDFKNGGLAYACKSLFLANKSNEILAGNIVGVILIKLLIFGLCLLVVGCLFTLANIKLKDYQKSGIIIGLFILSSMYISFREVNVGFLAYINPFFTLFYEKFYFGDNNFAFIYGIALICIFILIIYWLINVSISKYEFLEDHHDFRS